MDTATIQDTMDIFISWSGPRSGALAEALKKWLPMIVNAFKPWYSSADIDKGARWSADVAGKLQAARAGIICLTPSNLSAPWILFEAGALSKTLENTFVCPLLVDLQPSDVTGPMAQFQATRATKDEMLRLLRTLNGGLKELALPAVQIEEAFEVWWPRLEAELNNLPADGPAQRPQRTDRELLEEIVDSIRGKAASDALQLAKAEERVMVLSARLDHAESSLLLERDRLHALQRDLSWASDPATGAWRVAGGEAVVGGREIRGVTAAPHLPSSKAGQHVDALPLQKARKADLVRRRRGGLGGQGAKGR